uniref:Pept_C1 domain-containing protein n=1 Tax=Strongyloides papillosus TaxID=174720 RepID=A0A0N5BQP3_STREA
MKESYYFTSDLSQSDGFNDTQFKNVKIHQFYGKKVETKKSNFKLYLLFCLSVFLVTSLVVKLIRIFPITNSSVIEKSSSISLMCDFNIPKDEQLILYGRTNNKEREFICQFLNFLNDFNKTYETIEEKKSRFENFLKNIEIMNEKDNVDDSVTFKINKYSDWSDEELKKLLMSDEEIQHMDTLPYTEDFYYDTEFLNNENKSNFDWRDRNVITPVKDQGKCGSCAFFANVAVIESVNAIKGRPLTRLSEQELLDCDTKDNGCDGANRVNIFQYAEAHGVVHENYYQYRGVQSECRNMTGRPRVYIHGYKYLGRNEDSWINYLENHGPFSVGVQVPKQMYYYSSGVFNPTEEDCKQKSMGSHAMAVIGYGEENGQKYWLLKNSWGQGYGFDNGFIKMKRGVNSCGIANYAYGVKI